MAFKWKSFLNKLKDVVVPIVGTAVGGPLGGILGGALAGATGRGRPKLGNIVRGAGTAAAGIGLSKGLSALKGAMTGAGSATEAVTRGVTEPTALLAKGKEFIPTQTITPPPVSPLASAGSKAARIAGGAGASASAAGTAAPASGFNYMMIGGDRGQFLDALPPEARQTAQRLYDLSNRAQTASRLADAGGGATNTTSRLAEMPSVTPASSDLLRRGMRVPSVSGSSVSMPNLNDDGGVMDKLKGLFGKGGWLERNPEIAKGIAMGAFEAFQEDPRMAQLEFEKKAYEDEQERRKRVAELLRPLYEQTYRSLGS